MKANSLKRPYTLQLFVEHERKLIRFHLLSVCTHHGAIRHYILSMFENDKMINSPTTITIYIHTKMHMH